MANVDISARLVGDDQLRTTLHRLGQEDVRKAIRAGVRYAAGRGKTVMAKHIGQRYTLKASRIKDDIYAPQFRDGGETAVISTKRKPISARQFGLREGKRDITIAIFRGERTRIPGGFMQTSEAGKFEGRRAFRANRKKPYTGDTKAISFARAVRGERNRRIPRHGLSMVHGPSLHAIYTGGKWKGPIQFATNEVLSEALEFGIIRSLQGMGRGYGRA